jgi:hypothetical protein
MRTRWMQRPPLVAAAPPEEPAVEPVEPVEAELAVEPELAVDAEALEAELVRAASEPLADEPEEGALAPQEPPSRVPVPPDALSVVPNAMGAPAGYEVALQSVQAVHDASLAAIHNLGRERHA